MNVHISQERRLQPRVRRSQVRNPLLGTCGYKPFPDRGAYGHWSCERRAWHIGPHRFINYTTPRFLGRFLAYVAPRRLAYRVFPRSRYRPVDLNMQRTRWACFWTGAPRPASRDRAYDRRSAAKEES